MNMTIIKKNSDFKRVYYRGKNYVSPYFILYVFKNKRIEGVRFGVTASKKIGIAVKRNRAKRVLRAAFSTFYEKINCGYDIILVARTKTAFIKSTDILPIMEELLKNSGVLNEGMV